MAKVTLQHAPTEGGVAADRAEPALQYTRSWLVLGGCLPGSVTAGWLLSGATLLVSSDIGSTPERCSEDAPRPESADIYSVALYLTPIEPAQILAPLLWKLQQVLGRRVRSVIVPDFTSFTSRPLTYRILAQAQPGPTPFLAACANIPKSEGEVLQRAVLTSRPESMQMIGMPEAAPAFAPSSSEGDAA